MPRARPPSRSIYPASSSFLRCLYAVWELLRPTASPTSRTLGGPSPLTFARARRLSISILTFQFSGTTRASSERLAMTLYTILP
jgi:predicted small integral membrane protein